MTEDGLTARIQALTITDPEAQARTAEAMSGAVLQSKRRRGRALLGGVAGVVAAGVLALTPAGAALADRAGELIGVNGSTEQIEQASEEGEAYFDGIFQAAIDKARAGELQADVNPAEVERVMSAAMDPPADSAKASELETRTIELLAKLRAAGDLPPAGSSAQPVPGG